MQGGHRRPLRGWEAVDVPDCAVGRAGEEGDAAAREGPRPGGHGGAPRRRPRLRRLRLRRGRRSLRQDRRGRRRGVRISTNIRIGYWETNKNFPFGSVDILTQSSQSAICLRK